MNENEEWIIFAQYEKVNRLFIHVGERSITGKQMDFEIGNINVD